MHHLVNERLERVVPAMATNVTTTDRDLGRHCADRARVVTEAALHAARDADGDRPQSATEFLGIESLVLLDQAGGPGFVIGMCALAPLQFFGCSRRSVRDDELPCLAPNGLRAPLDNPDNGVEDLRWGIQIAAMKTHLGA